MLIFVVHSSNEYHKNITMKFENPRVDGMSPSKVLAVLVIVLYITWFGDKGAMQTGLDWLNNQTADGRLEWKPKEPQSPWTVNRADTSTGPTKVIYWSHKHWGWDLVHLYKKVGRQPSIKLNTFRTCVNVLMGLFSASSACLKFEDHQQQQIITLNFTWNLWISSISVLQPSKRRTCPIKKP